MNIYVFLRLRALFTIMLLTFVNHRDLSSLPDLSFSDVEWYAKSKNKSSWDRHISKGVKYYSEKYIEEIKGKFEVLYNPASLIL